MENTYLGLSMGTDNVGRGPLRLSRPLRDSLCSQEPCKDRRARLAFLGPNLWPERA